MSATPLTAKETQLKLEELEAALDARRIPSELVAQAHLSRAALTAELNKHIPLSEGTDLGLGLAMRWLDSGLPAGTPGSKLSDLETTTAELLKDAARFGPEAVANMKAALEEGEKVKADEAAREAAREKAREGEPA